MYIVGQKQNSQVEVDEINDKEDLLKYLNEKYLISLNLYFLQGLFMRCKAQNLYDICLRYAQTRENELRYLEKRILEKGKKRYIDTCTCLFFKLHFEWQP